MSATRGARQITPLNRGEIAPARGNHPTRVSRSKIGSAILLASLARSLYGALEKQADKAKALSPVALTSGENPHSLGNPFHTFIEKI
jgi:hypothetical protein